MSKPILTALEEHAEKKLTSFHMPGHKGSGPLSQFYQALTKYGLSMDVTELPGLDNLQCPQGIFKEAEERVADLMGTRGSLLLVNGATAGILASFLAATRPGQRVLLPRNSHRAFWSALVLGDLEPIFVMPDYYQQYQLVLPASLGAYQSASGHSKTGQGKGGEIQALAAINPTYEGFTRDLSELVGWAREQQLACIVDEAHGSLFPLDAQLPPSGIELGADLIVHGTHKTLGSLTQTGLVHLGTERVSQDKLRQALQMVQTTSPSYLLLASLDEAIRRVDLEPLIQMALEVRGRIGKIAGISLVDEEVLSRDPRYGIDVTRLVLSGQELGLSGWQLEEILGGKYGIQGEMAQAGYVVLLLGTGTTEAHLKKLTNALEDIGASHRQGKNNDLGPAGDRGKSDQLVEYIFKYSGPAKARLLATPRESFYAETKIVNLTDAAGSLAGELICPYPPGIPLIYPGELITQELVELLQINKYMKTIKILYR